jgi:hypothetical protein
MSEKAFRVNISFEEELLSGKRITQLNHHFESLFMFLENKTLASNYEYSPYYLDYVESITKQKPKIKKISDGDYDWWGERNSENKKIASKLFAYELLGKRNLLPADVKLIYDKDTLNLLEISSSQILKTAYSSSGRGIFKVDKLNNFDFPIIVENLRNRLKDFSTYFFTNDRKIIYYENIVDQNFAYKGSVYRNLPECDFTSISLNAPEWPNLIKDVALEIGNRDFCIDAYTYEDQGLKFFPMSEINPRRTMGRTGYELALKYFPNFKYASFKFFSKKNLKLDDKLQRIKKLGFESNILIFSMDDARFEVVLFASDTEEALAKIEKNYLMSF